MKDSGEQSEAEGRLISKGIQEMVIITEGTPHCLDGAVWRGIDSVTAAARTNTYHLIALKGCQVIHCH